MIDVVRSEVPDAPVRAAALAIAEASQVVDGAAPFDEHTLLALDTVARAGEQHLVVTADDVPVGYAHLDAPADGRPGSAELAVHPGHRRRGFGRVLLAALVEAAGGPLRVWSHGDRPGARALAAAAGFTVVRELLQLRVPLAAAPVVPELPEGVTLRTFVPGKDEEEWLALNARAFAHHPEQGRMTRADLDAREAEPWFDPEGFLIAEAEGAMAGFHWTKAHEAAETGEGAPLGEVYVVGVDPDRHGGGLGKALTAAGLAHLYGRGLRSVLLYVESDNAPALAVYRRLGFTRHRSDVMYESPSRAASGAPM